MILGVLFVSLLLFNIQIFYKLQICLVVVLILPTHTWTIHEQASGEYHLACEKIKNIALVGYQILQERGEVSDSGSSLSEADEQLIQKQLEEEKERQKMERLAEQKLAKETAQRAFEKNTEKRADIVKNLKDTKSVLSHDELMKKLDFGSESKYYKWLLSQDNLFTDDNGRVHFSPADTVKNFKPFADGKVVKTGLTAGMKDFDKNPFDEPTEKTAESKKLEKSKGQAKEEIKKKKTPEEEKQEDKKEEQEEEQEDIDLEEEIKKVIQPIFDQFAEALNNSSSLLDLAKELGLSVMTFVNQLYQGYEQLAAKLAETDFSFWIFMNVAGKMAPNAEIGSEMSKISSHSELLSSLSDGVL